MEPPWIRKFELQEKTARAGIDVSDLKHRRATDHFQNV